MFRLEHKYKQGLESLLGPSRVIVNVTFIPSKLFCRGKISNHFHKYIDRQQKPIQYS